MKRSHFLGDIPGWLANAWQVETKVEWTYRGYIAIKNHFLHKMSNLGDYV